jgi:DAACS family dicarboxylate/amino acid:cation (Na+ or H+) symporter
MSSPADGRRGMPLHTKILLGLLIGTLAGVFANWQWAGDPRLEWVVDNVAQPVGQIFLRLLFMVVVPLIFTSLSLGVASLGDLKRVGRIGAKTIGFFLLTTGLAATIGLTMVNLVRPGDSLDAGTRDQLMAEYSTQATERAELAEEGGFGINTFVNIVPRNPIEAAASGQMLSLIFFTLIFGIALTQVAPARAEPVLRVLEGISEAVMVIIGFAMKLAPYGVAGLIFSVTAKFGAEVLRSLALYVVMVLVGLAIQQFAVIPFLARVLAGVGPVTFFRRARALMITAFSTSSSNATLPTTIRTAQENFGVPPAIAGFVLPLGATMNMNGTALFEGMTVLFLAQVFGVDLSMSQQLLVIGMSVITAVGAAGVPGGSIPLLVLVLEMVGVPGMAIALILGVDRILDMSRTVPNVTGDLLTSLVITRSEGLPFVIPDVPLSASGEPVPAAGEGAVG